MQSFPCSVRHWNRIANEVLDPRSFEASYDLGDGTFDIRSWRSMLRNQLATRRDYRSDISGARFKPADRVHLHEGMFTRAQIPRGIDWHYMIFHEYNCFLLHEKEHIPLPPNRIQCYWLSVCRHGQPVVDDWIDNLPWKVRPDTPWAGTDGREIVLDILRNSMETTWDLWELAAKQFGAII